MFTAAGVRVGVGAGTSGAASPCDGKGACRASSAAAVANCAAGAGSCGASGGEATGGAAGRGGAGASVSELPLRLPNTPTTPVSGRALHKFGDERRQQAAARALGFRTPGQNLCEMPEHLCCLM